MYLLTGYVLMGREKTNRPAWPNPVDPKRYFTFISYNLIVQLISRYLDQLRFWKLK